MNISLNNIQTRNFIKPLFSFDTDNFTTFEKSFLE